MLHQDSDVLFIVYLFIVYLALSNNVFNSAHRESQVELREHIDNLATGDFIHTNTADCVYLND